MTTSPCKGRFAPSPSGPLHFGSLVCALASYADIKSKHGKWLVRIEDIDPPREVRGSSRQILLQLESHGLHWDDSVVYQSNRLSLYSKIINDLQSKKTIYFCDCNRARLKKLEGVYDNFCKARQLTSKGNATRLIVDPRLDHISFNDAIFGWQKQNLTTTVGDFIIRRRDGLISYQLAVTVDDNAQGITDIMRGSDLLGSTHRQIFLQRMLGFPQPNYAHLPIATSENNLKLSKQNLALALPFGRESKNLWIALKWLNQDPPQDLQLLSTEKIVGWAVENWDPTKIPPKTTLQAPGGFYKKISNNEHEN